MPTACATIDSDWPDEDPGVPDDLFNDADEFDDEDFPLELDGDDWDPFAADDDYEPQPEYGDFWTEVDWE